MEIKVSKFGGTSMADANAINQSASIVLSDPARRFVVVSAPGKRFPGDEKITDLLYRCCEEANATGSCKHSFSKVRDRFEGIIRDLRLNLDLSDCFTQTQARIENERNADYAASRGEYFSAMIMAAKLNYKFVDSADIIEFTSKGDFDSEHTNDLASKALKDLDCAVIPGFYGSMPGGEIKTFSRGGSDITGSIVARAVSADLYENWTDVNGFMTADPRIVKDPKVIDCLTYHELRELAYMGASVLHAEAIFPVRICNIPVNIRNTFAPEFPGTMIVPDEARAANRSVVTGIAGKKDFTIIFIEKSMMNNEVGFVRKVLSILELYNISFEHVPSGIDTMSLIISTAELKGKEVQVVSKIKSVVNPDSVILYEELALIALVGRGMCRKIGVASKLFNAVSEAGVNLRMIDQGSSEMNIVIGVDNKDYEKSIAAIYQAFMGED